MHVTSISVLDHAGQHTGIWTPPPSRQPGPSAKSTRFDRCATMRRAWADYRAAVKKGWTELGRFDPDRWSYCLRMAWMVAKVEVEKAQKLARPVVIAAPKVIADPAARARAETIRGELMALEMSDAWSIHTDNRERALRAELHQLTG